MAAQTHFLITFSLKHPVDAETLIRDNITIKRCSETGCSMAWSIDLSVGDTVFLKRALGEVALGEVGLCVGFFERGDRTTGVYLLFGNGFIDGYSLREVEKIALPHKRYPALTGYRFSETYQAVQDMYSGQFAEALPARVDETKPLPWWLFEVIMKDWHVNQECAAQLLGVPWATLRTWKARDDIPQSVVHQIEALQLLSGIKFRLLCRRRGVTRGREVVRAMADRRDATDAE